METKTDITAILKDKPKGTKLYSPIFGNLRYENLVPDLGEFTVVTSDNTFAKHSFRSDSKYNRHGEPLMLLPSKEMRDWSKFAWKKGDVLVNNNSDTHIIFKGFSKSDYTTFEGKHWISVNKKRYVSYLKMQNVQDYHIEDNTESAQTYINTIEEKLGGKLNMETLEIEKTEFKDGDIAYADYGHKQAVFIVSGKINLSEGYNSLVALDLRGLDLDMGYMSFFKEDLYKLRLATDEEKQQLFKALAKKGKVWIPEKKQIVDLKPKVELKPFDKVLVRDSKASKWRANLFSHKNIDEPYYCVWASWNYCIPYEGNEHLLGTTKDVEE